MSRPGIGGGLRSRRAPEASAALCASALLSLLCPACASPASSTEVERPPVVETELVSPALEAKMAMVAGAIEQRGFASAAEPARAFLVEQGALVEPTSLPTGRCQVFVALGSQALRELSLAVFDSGGTELASASSPSPSVALRFCPDLPGTHYVAVRALAGDGLVSERRFEGPSGIAIDLDDLFAPPENAAEAP